MNLKLKGINVNNSEIINGKEVIKTDIFKNKDLVHTIVFVK